MGLCLTTKFKKDKTVEKIGYGYTFTESDPKPMPIIKNKTRKKTKESPKPTKKCVWDAWQASEKSNRAERKVKKMRYLTQCELDAGKKRRKIGAAYGGRRKKSSNRIPNDRAIKQDRKKRRQRQIRDSYQWTLHP